MKTLLIIIFTSVYGEKTAEVHEFNNINDCRTAAYKYRTDTAAQAHCVKLKQGLKDD